MGHHGHDVPKLLLFLHSLIFTVRSWETHGGFPAPPLVPGPTVWEIGVTELQILAGTRWVMLSAQWMLHLLNFQFQGIQRPENFLHAICVVHVVVGVPVVHQLAGVNISPGPLGSLDGQRLDDFSRRTLVCGERRYNFSSHWQWGREKRWPKQPPALRSSITRYTLDMYNTRDGPDKNAGPQARTLGPSSLVIFPLVTSPFTSCFRSPHL